MKNSNDTIGNRIRDSPACSAVPQPTAPTHVKLYYQHINEQMISRNTLSCNNYYDKMFLDVISYYFIPALSLRLALGLLSHHINNRKEPN